MATLYHGTTSTFGSFSLDPPQRRDSGNLGRGVYLTADPERAMIYAEANAELWGGTPAVLQVEADLGRVAIFDRALMGHLRREEGITFPPAVWDHERSERLRWWFLDHGFDSVKNMFMATEVCVFDPARLRIVGKIPYVSSRDRLIRAYEEKLGKPWPGKRNPGRDLALVTLDHQGRHFETGVPVTFRFVRNTAPSPYMGERFQQHIEPAGRYMTHVENPRLPVDPSGRMVFETGLVTFKSPLVLLGSADDQGYGPNSWKARLADHYQATGLELSKAILEDGHDGIVTVSSVRGELYTSEIVDLGVISRSNPPMGCTIVSLSEDSDFDAIYETTDRDPYELMEEAEKLFASVGIRISSVENLHEACVSPGGRILGASVVGLETTEPYEWDDEQRPRYVFSIAVLEEARRRGIARGLIESLMEGLPSDEVLLEGKVVNPHMAVLLGKLGFRYHEAWRWEDRDDEGESWTDQDHQLGRGMFRPNPW